MSKEIDQKVVEMRFDNRQFETNVRTTMSSLDKLKQHLQFKGATKGVTELDKATKQLDFKQIENTACQAGFHIQDVWLKMATVFEYQVARKIINLGTQMAKALTIDPIKTGFQEYETQMNAVQTILANTASKGSTIKDVNKALDELNAYADKTIYNFTEMTRNIGTFTAAGIDLETSVNSIQGIANLAAVSGSTSQQASTAMYQLSQALAAGTVKLMDWNSVVNAGMGGEMFQNALKETSKELGTGAEAAIKASGSFRESLKDGWLTAEVLTATLKKFTTSGANEYVAEYTGLSIEAVEAALKEAEARYGEAEAIEKASDALAEKSGKNKEEIKAALQFAKNAEDAATKVKTFSQLWDVMKEAAQSGWAQTWRLIVGDFEQAKALLTPLADFFTGIIGRMNDARNTLLEGALGKTFTDLAKKIKGVVDPVKDATKAVSNVVDTLKDYNKLADEIIAGKWGNAPTRWQDLAAAGYDWAHAQNLVNEKLGNSKRHATDYKEAQQGVTEATTEMTEATAKELEELTKLSEAELKRLGYSPEQIAAIKQLKKEADKLGMSVSDFLSQIDTLDGRTILMNSFKNIGQGLVKTFKAMAEAWKEIFPPMTSNQLYNIIAGFHKLSTRLRMSDETADNLKRTFKGLFAILDIVLTIVGGPIKIAFKLFTKLLGAMDIDILKFTAKIGDAIVKFRDWLDATLDFNKAAEYLGSILKPVTEKIKEWFKAFADLPAIQSAVSKLKNTFSGDLVSDGFSKGFKALGKILSTVWKGLVKCYEAFMSIPAVKNTVGKVGEFLARIFSGIANSVGSMNFESIINGISKFFDIVAGFIRKFGEGGGHIISGLVSGLGNGVKAVFGVIVAICEGIYNAFTSFFGIHSPSTVFIALGGFLIAGLVAGVLGGKTDAKEAIGDLGVTILEAAKTAIDTVTGFLKSLDLGTVIAATGVFGLFTIAKRTLEVLELFGKGVESFGNMCDGAGEMMKAVAERISPKKGAFEKIAESVLKMAISIAILAGAVYVLAQLDHKKMWDGVLAIAALTGVVLVLAGAAKLLKGADGSFAKLALGLVGVSITMLILSKALASITQSIGTMKPGVLDQATEYLIGFGVFMLALTAIAKFGKGTGKGLLGMFLGVSVALLALAKVTEALGSLEPEQIDKAKWYLIGFGAVIASLVGFAKFGKGAVAGLGAMFAGIAVALLAMSMCVKSLGGLDETTLKRGLDVVAGFMVLIAGLMVVVALLCNGTEVMGMAGLFAGVGMALIAMATSVKILGGLDKATLEQGCLAIAQFMILIGILMMVAMIGDVGKGLFKTLLGVSVALATMAGIVVILGFMPDKVVDKGLKVVVGIGAILAVLIGVSKLAQGSAGAIWGITAMLAVVTASIMILSKIDANALTPATIAMGVLMGIVAAALGVSKLAAKSMGSIIAMTVLIGILGGVMYLLAGLPAGQVIASAVSLSVLLGVLTGVFIVLGTFGSMLGTAMMGVVGLLGLCVPLLAVVGILYLMEGLNNAIGNVGVLTLLLVTMTAMLLALSVVGGLIVPALAGVVGLLALCVPLLAFIGILYLMEGLDNAIANVGVLMTMMNALGNLMIILAMTGPLALVGVVALTALTSLIVGVGVLATAVGALMTKFPALEQFVDKGISVLEKLAHGIGSIIGNIIAGFGDAVTGNLPEIGMRLGMFMTNAMPFILGAKMVDESVSKGIKALATAILILTGADMLSGIGSFFGASSGFASFGTELSMFMTNAMPFILGISSVSAESLQAVKYLAEAIMILTKADILDGLTSWLTGGVDLGAFGTSIGDLGTGLATFSESLSGFDEEDMNVVKLACESIKILAEAAKEIPNDGGWAGKIFGENGLGAFSEKIPTVGTALKNFVTNIGTFGDKEAETVKRASEAVKNMADVAKEIPNEDGWAAKIFGDNSIGEFGEQIKSVGTNLSEFVKSVSNIDDNGYSYVTNAVEIISAFSNIGNNLPSDDKIKSLKTFAGNIKTIGEKMNGLWKEIGQFGGDTKKRADAVCYVLNKFAGVADKVGGKSGDMLKKFAGNVKSIGGEMNGLWKAIGQFGGDTKTRADAVCYVLDKFAGVADKVGGKSGGMLKTFATNVKAVGGEMNGLWNEIGQFGTGTKERAAAVCEVLDMFSASANKCTNDGSQLTNITTAIQNTIDGALNITRSSIESFQNAGKNLVEGFARGISLNRHIASMAAKQMANDAELAARKALDEHSPSRVFEGIGKFAVMGLANGLNKVKMATDAGRDLGNAVLEATQDELGIHSPSIVFDKKVGRYIVQGIANGIEEESSAEKAAREKADAIVNAFKKEIDKVNLEGEIQSNNLELWKLGEGRNADEATKYAEDEKFLMDEWRRKQKSQDWYYYQWEEMKAYYEKGKVNYEAVKNAENDYIKSQYETLTAKEAVDNLKKNKPFEALEKTIADNEKAIEIRSALQENWLKTDGKYLSGEAQDARLLEDSRENLRNYENMLTAEQQKHELLIQQQSTALDQEQAAEAIHESYMKQRELESKIADEKELIVAIQNNAAERELDNLDKQMELRDKELELAKAELGNKATDDQLDALDKSNLIENLKDLNKQVEIEKEQWEELKKLYEEGKATLEEVDAAYAEYLEAKTQSVNTQNEISQLEEDAAERRQEALEKQYSFASDNADTLYQIWEKTEGKKASGAEKDIKKISMLSEQLSAQSSLLVLAREEWEDAKRDYGRSSTEAQEAYSNYLRKQLDVANLQSEITDINEKTATRQKAAAAEYKDYIKKYEKYYELNGMSREELEKDAKLVSGYDANKTVNKMLSSTKDALNNIYENKDYTEISEGFKTLGTSYVDAVSTGVTSQSSTLTTTLLMMSLDCLEILSKDIDKWTDIGKRCVEGFVSGIESNIYLAAQEAARMAQEAIRAAKAEFDINSPSRAFADIGMYAVMGLAKGFTDNSYLSNVAASELGSRAIDNLRSSISRISDIVNSEVDTQPTIRPVLDLSDIKSKTKTLNAMFSSEQAMAISASMNDNNRINESQNGNVDAKSGNKYEFNQYNYSPKALSRADIYRQTKNQFAAMKGELT